jgi:hypothetical protein
MLDILAILESSFLRSTALLLEGMLTVQKNGPGKRSRWETVEKKCWSPESQQWIFATTREASRDTDAAKTTCSIELIER